MAEGTLTLLGDAPEEIAPDPLETRLRTLYAHRPGVVRLGMLVTTDGRAAAADGSSGSLGGPEDARIMHVLRSLCDVVVVGAQTARRERYADIVLPGPMIEARERLGQRATVDIAVATHGGILPPGLTPERTWVLTHGGSPAISRLGPAWASRIIIAGADDLSPRTALRELVSHGLPRMLCEGGPTLARRLLQRSIIDEYCLTESPRQGGAQAPETPPVPPDMAAAHTLEGGGFTMRRWVRR